MSGPAVSGGGSTANPVAEKLAAIADDVRADIKQARADGDNERRHYLRGELQGLLEAYDLVLADEKERSDG